MGIEIPIHLSKEFFVNALKAGLNSSSITINDLKIEIGSSAGDNFLSEIYRANVTYTNEDSKQQNISLIVKALAYSENRGPVLDDMKVYEKEIQMYTDTLLKMSEMLNNEFLCAKFYYATREPIPTIVFEDLNVKGYVMVDRRARLDVDHCNIVVKKLARMHAASTLLAEKDPHSMDLFNHGLIKSDGYGFAVLDSIFGGNLTSLTEVIETWPGYEKIAEKLKVLRVDFPDKMSRHCNNTPASIKVLNHGDAWVNNFLFKYKDGKVVDVVFVDYQLSFYSSPGIDMNYFLCTSPMCKVREERRELILKTYYNEFVRIRQMLGSKETISYENMKREISTREFYGFIASMVTLPLVVLNREASEATDFESLAKDDASKKNVMFTEPLYEKAMKCMLKRFDELKVLDNLY